MDLSEEEDRCEDDRHGEEDANEVEGSKYCFLVDTIGWHIYSLFLFGASVCASTHRSTK